MNDLTVNNIISIAGRVATKPEFSYNVYDENFYGFVLESPRLSENVDKVEIIVSEKIMDTIEVGDYVKIDGQVRTYNKEIDNTRKLLIFVFVKNIDAIEKEEFETIKNPNNVELIGYVCKAPVFRTTPFGREITDVLIAVNRAYKKSDYIPIISWGRNAKYASKFEIGDKIKITGRLQSRDYVKKIDDKEMQRTAYELSVSNMIKIEKEAIEEVVESIAK